MDPIVQPSLERRRRDDGVTLWTDPSLASLGVIVAFSERGGGVSAAPYDGLNLAGHVGDEASAVDTNRTLLLDALGISRLRKRLVTAEQVHGERVGVVGEGEAGSGAFAGGGEPPLPACDVLLTSQPDTPLLMLYADCVPVVMVASGSLCAVCVVHAGWRGALASLPGKAAVALSEHAKCAASDLVVYVGPHIAACCYEMDENILSHFCNTFDTIGAVDDRLDLTAAIRESLTRAGVNQTRIVEVNECTRDHTDRFFSYRASPLTGRHGALAVIAKART